jgi:hypothetical protein
MAYAVSHDLHDGATIIGTKVMEKTEISLRFFHVSKMMMTIYNANHDKLMPTAMRSGGKDNYCIFWSNLQLDYERS